MAVTAHETEIKYDLPGGVALPPLDGLPMVAATGEPEEERLEAEYYDTADLRLIRAGITLRRRRGGHDAGWHLKLPAGQNTRREIRLPLGRTGRRVPRELADLVRAHTRTETLGLVVQMTTARRWQLLLGPAGESLAEVAADDVSAHTLGESTVATRWQEVEVELTGGDGRLLRAADKLLRRHGLIPAARSAKLERALGLEQPVPAGSPGTGASGSGPAGRSATAGQVIQAYLAGQAGLLLALDPMVRQDEPDAVHQMRVAIRRLRSTLRSFPEVIGADGAERPDSTERLAAELEWLGDLLGQARDAEVLAGHLTAALGDTPPEQVIGPVQARLREHFAPAGAAAKAKVLAALGSGRYFALLDELDRLVAEPSSGPAASRPAGAALAAATRRAYRRTRRRMRAAWHQPPGPGRDAALHQARKAARRARFAAEAAALAAGPRASRFARQVKKVQSVLGDHQDTVIARQAERQLGMAAHLDGQNAFSYGLLWQRDADLAARLQHRARAIWHRASRRRYRHWLR
jgi:CHAD domain-containing protein